MQSFVTYQKNNWKKKKNFKNIFLSIFQVEHFLGIKRKAEPANSGAAKKFKPWWFFLAEFWSGVNALILILVLARTSVSWFMWLLADLHLCHWRLYVYKLKLLVVTRNRKYLWSETAWWDLAVGVYGYIKFIAKNFAHIVYTWNSLHSTRAGLLYPSLPSISQMLDGHDFISNCWGVQMWNCMFSAKIFFGLNHSSLHQRRGSTPSTRWSIV